MDTHAAVSKPGMSSPKAESNRLGLTEHVLIDDVLADRLAVERAQDIACGLLAHPIHRFPRNAGDVRRHDDVRKLKQRMTGRRRLLLENIKAGTGELARDQRVIQRRLVDNSATCRVYQIGCWRQGPHPRRLSNPPP